MELRHLRYFVAVVETHTFRAAAEKIHVVQPAISRQIKALEAELGVSLFKRLARRVELTETGRIFFLDAKRILADADAASERALRVGKGQVGLLKVGFNEVGLWQRTVLQAIRSFRANYPDVELQLVPLDSRQQRDALRDGRIDAGFLYALPQDRVSFEHLPVQQDDVAVALLNTHRLAKRSKLDIQHLDGEPMIWSARQSNAYLYDALTAAWFTAGLVPNILQETTTGILVLSLVGVGMGLGIVTTGMRWQMPEGVLLKPVQNISVPLHLDLVWRANNNAPALQHFVRTTLDATRA